MRIHTGLMLAALTSLGFAQQPGQIVTAIGDSGYTYGEVKRRSMPAGHAQGQRRLRSRWKADRPKRRPNRMRISKRTRRKHRRAA